MTFIPRYSPRAATTNIESAFSDRSPTISISALDVIQGCHNLPNSKHVGWSNQQFITSKVFDDLYDL